MMHPTKADEDRHFPLKRYYLFYGGIGSLLFYVLLFMLFIRAERQALYDEYAHGVSEKARIMFMDIQRDFLAPRDLRIDQVESFPPEQKTALRKEIEDLVTKDFRLAQIKLFRADGLTLYDHASPENQGLVYTSRDEPGFVAATAGRIHSDIEAEESGHRFMEAYLPIRQEVDNAVIAVLEIYEDVTRFETQVKNALKQALALPTAVFICFNLVLFWIVARADRIIAEHTRLLVSIRRNMEKYLSPSAVAAIYQAVSKSTELFRGQRQSLVVFFSDVRDFTAYSETTPPEQVVQTLNALFELQAGILHRHGGVIDKFVGDEIMATFTAGGEVRATRAALEILEAIGNQKSIGQKIGIGIHSGEAVVGSLGTATRRDYTAIGDVINTGARICAACPPNSLYVSEAVYARLPTATQNRFSAPMALALKGKAENFGVRLFPIKEANEARSTQTNPR